MMAIYKLLWVGKRVAFREVKNSGTTPTPVTLNCELLV